MFLRRQGFRPSAADPCFYIRDKGEKKLLLVLYVDDGIPAASDMEDLNLFLAHVKAEFEITIKNAIYFLGIETEIKQMEV